MSYQLYMRQLKSAIVEVLLMFSNFFCIPEMMFGVRIIITGDKLVKSENSIIILNHRCRLDWMFYWSVVARYGELHHEKIIMKHELKHIPGPGKLFIGNFKGRT